MKPAQLLALLAPTILLTTLSAQTPQEQSVLAPIQSLFAAMTQRDPTALQAAFIPGATLLSLRDGKPTQLTAEAFAERISKPSPTHIEERIHDPLIRVDRDLAVVWAPFDFLLDGKIDHCGTDLFNLVLTNGAWRIASITWNSTAACPAHR